MEPAPFASTLVLTVNLAMAAFLATMGVVLLVDHPVSLPCFPAEQNQDSETLLYLSAFLVLLPLALFIGPRLADRIASGPNRPGLGALTGLLAAAMALAIVASRVANLLFGTDAVGATLGATALWWAGAVAAIWRAAQPRAWRALLRVSKRATSIWTLAGILVFAVLLCLARLSSASPLALVVAAPLIAGTLVAGERGGWRWLRWPWRIFVDASVVALVLLAVPDLIVVHPEQASGNAAVSADIQIIQFHQNFLLGPANEVLSGGAMLVDTVSQYGVAIIYFLVAWFALAPIGYGTFAFLSAACSAMTFAAGYGLLRIAGVSILLATGSLATAVIVLVFASAYPINAIPQDSALRFGLPMAVLLPYVAAERWPRGRTLAWAVASAVVGLSSVWSLEQFTYCAATGAALQSLAAWLRPGGSRLRWLAKQALWPAVACVCAHALLAILTYAATARLPDWGQYLAYLRAFLFGDLGELNFDVAPWSPGLAVGALYLTSAAAIVLMVLRQPGLVRAERTTIFALAAVTSYGVAIYSYYDNRSSDFILAAVALPAFLTATLWLSLLLRSHRVPIRMRRGGLAFALAVATLLVAVDWPAIGERFPHSALAHALPGGPSMQGALHRLWNMPPLVAAAPDGQRLLDRHMPGARRSLVVTNPDLETEILLRSKRGNALPLAAPWQDSFVADQRLPGLGRAVDSLEVGQRILIDSAASKAFAFFRANPSIDPLANRCDPEKPSLIPSGLAPLQDWALKRIGARFDWETIESASSGLSVVELIPRR